MRKTLRQQTKTTAETMADALTADQALLAEVLENIGMRLQFGHGPAACLGHDLRSLARELREVTTPRPGPVRAAI